MSEQMRKEFEEFAARKYGALAIGMVGDYYSCDNVRNDWYVWQASRATVVVLMPESDDGWLDKQIVEYALVNAGVSYK